MKKIKIDSKSLVSFGAVALTGVAALLKLIDGKNQAEKEKEEIVNEVMERLSKKD